MARMGRVGGLCSPLRREDQDGHGLFDKLPLPFRELLGTPLFVGLMLPVHEQQDAIESI